MSAHSAERRLVKSSPELWTEVSDQESLARRLHAFGEIRITGTDPDSTVAWEGESVSGTVAIEAAGWGTKVTLTVEVEGEAVEPAPEEPPAEPAAETSIEAEAVSELEAAVEPEAEAAPETQLAAEPEQEAAPAPEPVAVKKGFFARLFDFGPTIPDPPKAPPVEEVTAEVPAPETAVSPEPEPEPAAEAEPTPEPVPEPVAPPEVEPFVSTEPSAAPAMSSDEIDAALNTVLDDLGAAHHRPFSRA